MEKQLTSRKEFVRSLGFAVPAAVAGSALLQASSGQAQSLPEVYSVKDFGAKGNGETDDTDAINECIEFAMSAGPGGENYKLGGTVYFPRGTYRVTDTINIHNVRGLIVTGEGHSASIIAWYGTDESKAIISIDGEHNTLSNLWITNQGGRKAFCAVRIRKENTGTWISTANNLVHIAFGDSNATRWTYCVDITNQGAAGTGQNNECHKFFRCRFNSYSKAAVHVFGSQVHALQFDDCDMVGNNVGELGVWCEYGAYIHWKGGSGGYHTGADFFLQNFHLLSTITGWNSEGSARFVTSGGQSTGASFPLTIKGCRFDSHNLHEDEYGILLNTPGPTSIEGCTFFSSTGTPRIKVGGLATPQLLKLDGNAFRGVENYPKEKVNEPTGGSFHGPVRHAGNPRIVDNGNFYWNHDTQANEWYALPRALSVLGLGTKEQGEAARNFAGSQYIGGQQAANATFYRGQELDTGYIVFCTIEKASGTVPPDLSVVVSDKTTKGFTLTLSEPAVGFAVYVNWMIVKT